ncbi:hypothetical protein HYZ97_01345 [Candidatus Pacearchaeota archaeon]|nr:hypothetical protein [Candidatus Pacearchaeota archaeon]
MKQFETVLMIGEHPELLKRAPLWMSLDSFGPDSVYDVTVESGNECPDVPNLPGLTSDRREYLSLTGAQIATLQGSYESSDIPLNTVEVVPAKRILFREGAD